MSEMSTESQPSEEPSMSDPSVSAFLTKQLCMHGGRLLVSEIPQLLSLKPEHIASILREGAHRFAEPQTGTLLAHSTVRLCAAYLRENCQATDCERLHLCRFFILGRCFRRGNRHAKCKFSHDCRSEVNRAVLKANEIANLNEKELRVLLLLNDAALLPEVCREYKGEKKDGSCTKGAECGRLHVCQYFVRGQCRYYRCNRSHDLLEPNPMRLLQGRGLSEEMIRNIQLMRIHLCNEARKEPWKEEPPRKNNNRDHPHSTTDTSHTKTAAPTECPQTDKLDVHESADPSPSPSSAIPTKYRRRKPSSESHQIDNSHVHVFVSPPPQPTIGVTKHPVTTPCTGILPTDKPNDSKSVSAPSPPTRNLSAYPATTLCTGILPTDKPNDRKSVSSHPPPAATVKKYPSTTLRTVILPTDKPNDRRSASPSPPSARNVSAYSMTTPHTGMLPDKPDNRKSVNPPPLTRTISTNPATTAHTGILLTDKPDERASVSSGTPITTKDTMYPAAMANTGIQPTKKPDAGMSVGTSPDATYTKISATVPLTGIHNYSKPTMRASDRPPTPYFIMYMEDSDILDLTEVPYNTKPDMSTSGVCSPTPHPITTKVNRYSVRTTTDETYSVTVPPTRTQLTKKTDVGVSVVPSPTYSDTVNREYFGRASDTRPASEVSAKSPAPRSSIYKSALFEPVPGTYVFQPAVSPSTVAPKAHGDPNEICIYHIWKFCKHQNKCPQMHYHLPYRWQISKGAGKWEDLPWMEDIEKAYSDPNNISSGQHDINFEKMTSAYHEVRRLSTASSVTKPPDYLMTTEWVWHWKNEHGKWIEYGNHGGKEKATMASADLETIYLADKNAVVPFQAGAQQYHLNFPGMTQTNLRYGTQKEVRRRPRFVSKEAVDKQKTSCRTTSPDVRTSSPVQGIPAHWDRTALPDVGFQLVDIGKTSPEFKGIEQSFLKTMSGYSILKIKRIQNITLWNFYQMQMEKMKKESKKDVLVKTLFHGTNVAHLDAICRHNFDWRICGVNGTVYGKGSYFARDASYSHNYCQSSSGSKTMFLARVLVGDSVKGHSSFTRPPPKRNNPNYLYDSCVDNENNPSIFVVFEKPQIYPEYIMEYAEEKKCCIS